MRNIENEVSAMRSFLLENKLAGSNLISELKHTAQLVLPPIRQDPSLASLCAVYDVLPRTRNACECDRDTHQNERDGHTGITRASTCFAGLHTAAHSYFYEYFLQLFVTFWWRRRENRSKCKKY